MLVWDQLVKVVSCYLYSLLPVPPLALPFTQSQDIYLPQSTLSYKHTHTTQSHLTFHPDSILSIHRAESHEIKTEQIKSIVSLEEVLAAASHDEILVQDYVMLRNESWLF